MLNCKIKATSQTKVAEKKYITRTSELGRQGENNEV